MSDSSDGDALFDSSDQSGTDCQSYADTHDESDMSTLFDWNLDSPRHHVLSDRVCVAPMGGGREPDRNMKKQRRRDKTRFQEQANHSIAGPSTANIPELYLVDSQGNFKKYRLVPAEVGKTQAMEDPRQNLECLEDLLGDKEKSSRQLQVPRRNIHPRHFESSILCTIDSMEDSSEIRNVEYVVFFFLMVVIIIITVVGLSTRPLPLLPYLNSTRDATVLHTKCSIHYPGMNKY
ncbi:hypothetical protein JMJ77_0000802 [Colletotrichum scovillei]|uniref:Uncharacterized protein n=1 Tax=Colletotrichum scovillei TaxID=1209932 RepID=A0A9P7RAA8_9PEZI|nr:hypothetical protein JMJ77_0000802 [Colletotrichum scovillei]KAG7072014.1 hypothetical protein JMJ76_0004878 [Colletotrichum scovillei]KAG7080258.1 hypothetical protein JMJ78_0007357 [Colletotrichum scovillei]